MLRKSTRSWTNHIISLQTIKNYALGPHTSSKIGSCLQVASICCAPYTTAERATGRDCCDPGLKRAHQLLTAATFTEGLRRQYGPSLRDICCYIHPPKAPHHSAPQAAPRTHAVAARAAAAAAAVACINQAASHQNVRGPMPGEALGIYLLDDMLLLCQYMHSLV